MASNKLISGNNTFVLPPEPKVPKPVNNGVVGSKSPKKARNYSPLGADGFAEPMAHMKAGGKKMGMSAPPRKHAHIGKMSEADKAFKKING